MFNSTNKKKNNSISSILGLNQLRNNARKMGSSIESGLKSARNTVTGSVKKASNTIMPEFISETAAQNNNNDSVSLGNLLVGSNKNNKNNRNNNRKNNRKNNKNNRNNINIMNNENYSEELESNVEQIGNEIKNNAMKVSAFAFGMGWFKYFLLFMILLFFGINIFSYLAKTSTYFAEVTESIFKPIAKMFGFSLTRTAEKVVDTSAEGAKYGIDITKNVIDDVLTLGQNGNGNGNSNGNSNNSNNNSEKESGQQTDTDNSFIGELEQDIATLGDIQGAEPSDVSYGDNVGKKGAYCLVGTDRGYRSCVKIGDSEKCMSGKVYSSNELCVNPSLRA